jgi:hypothetical protein
MSARASSSLGKLTEVQRLFVLLSLALAGCSSAERGQNAGPMHHPALDIAKWIERFPLAEFEKHEGPRQFSSTEAGSPLDLWKADGRIISSPVDIAVTEQVRRRAASQGKPGRAVPVHIFLWAAGPPQHPYLTKIGGVPHREKSKLWPTAPDGTKLTFVAQFCFLDSLAVVPEAPPGDVMLVYFRAADSYLDEDIYLEWSSRELDEPTDIADCPPPAFRVPELAGVLHRSHEYPDAEPTFHNLGHYQHWLFATTQSTKIGRETWFIQNDPRSENEHLLCTLNSLQPHSKWPFVNLESLGVEEKHDAAPSADFDMLMFGDVGCIYFLINKAGQVRSVFDCY